jgi:formate dehydrogenase (NADP+) alpha subunit
MPFQSRLITINGKITGFITGESVLHVANRNRIFIPTLCHDPRLSISGHCKVCFVEINGRLKPACTTKAEHGMVIETDSGKAKEARKKRVAAILRNHKGDCATCPQYEFCGLLELAKQVGIDNPVFTSEEKLHEEVVDQKLKINLNRCILCGKCVRVCAEIRNVGAIRHPVLSPEVDKITFDKKCEMCGQCAVICPTGAIIEIHREKPDRRVKSVCTYCGTGCSIYIDVKDDKITGITTDELDPVGKGNLCVKGRFGFTFIHHPDRLKSPLIKSGSTFKEASWDEAVSLIAERFTEIKEKYGPETIGGFGSARATNEDNYMFQRMMRAAIGTNNIDNCARLCHMPAATALKMAFGISASTSSFSDLEYSDVILVVGSNTTEAHPIGALHVKWAHTRGARLIIVDPRKIPLVEEADLHLQLRPGSNTALFNGMLRVMIEENLIYPEFIEKHTREWEKTTEMAFSLSLEDVESISGVPKENIIRASRMYGSSRRAIIISGLGVDENEYGTEWMLALINLSLATGNVGNPGTGVLCLRGQNNVQGACDMGCLPNMLPGYQTIRDGEVRRRFSECWGRPVPKLAGKKSTQMIDSAIEGGIKALYIWGEDPAHTHGDTLHIRESLKRLEFMVYQDIFHTRTADYADVILPAASFAEKDGTFTNTERRVRLLRKAIPPLYSSRADWEIFLDISNTLGLKSTFKNPAEIYDEMASLTYYFRGISHKRLRQIGLQWPCTHMLHPGTERLYIDGFPPGRATFYPIPYREPSEKLIEEYPLILITGRRLYHFNNASQTRRTDTAYEKDECLDINPEDISRFNLRDGQNVKMTSRRGEVTMRLKAEPSILPGTVFASFHLWEIPINILTGGARDTYTDTYSYKFTAVRVEKFD